MGRHRCDGLADQIDDAIDQMNDTIVINALVIPSDVVEQLDQFSNFLDTPDLDLIFEKQLKIDTLITAIDQRFKGLFDLMRNDLNADKLNHGLQKRIRGNWADKIMNT